MEVRRKNTSLRKINRWGGKEILIKEQETLVIKKKGL